MRQERRFVAHDGMCTHRQDPIESQQRNRSDDEQCFPAGTRALPETRRQRWGLTDCASFLIMEEKGITEALSADRDFQQAGFNALLLS
jgi:predicted nucleic acid-binding protein